MCVELGSQFVRALVQPDSRLKSSCCSEESGVKNLHGMFEKIRDAEGFEPFYDKNSNCWRHSNYKDGGDEDQFKYIDRFWLDTHMFDLEEEGKEDVYFKFDKSDNSTDLVILLGEADVLAPEMVNPPFRASPRMPKETEIHKWLRQSTQIDLSGVSDWDFVSRFTPRRFRVGASALPQPTASTIGLLPSAQSVH
jgi:hypothetical protein